MTDSSISTEERIREEHYETDGGDNIVIYDPKDPLSWVKSDCFMNVMDNV